MNENAEEHQRAAAVAAVDRTALAVGTHHQYSSSNYQYILWLMEHRSQLVNPELVAEVEEVLMTPLLSPAEKRINIRNLIQREWLGETYNGLRNCSL
jgi:hypothetical protein